MKNLLLLFNIKKSIAQVEGRYNSKMGIKITEFNELYGKRLEIAQDFEEML